MFVPSKDNSNNNQPAEPVGDTVDLKKSSGATNLVAKQIVKKYRNLTRKIKFKRLLQLQMIQQKLMTNT